MARIKGKIALITVASGIDRGCRRADRRGRRRAESCQPRAPETPILCRRTREPVAIASQVIAWSHDGCRHSKGPLARRTDGITASHPGVGQVVNPKLDRPR